MNKLSVIGLDLAKNVFQVHGINEEGDIVVRKQFKRREVLRYFVRLEPCLVGMEACAGAHYWSRELSKLGHCVRLMAPAFVKPYVKSNKNDRNDAEAICEAVQRPNMRFVAAKTPEQQAILHLHHGRQLLLQQRVALNNHMRAVLLEYGISLPKGAKVLSQCLLGLLEDAENQLPMITRHLLGELKMRHDELNTSIAMLENQIKSWHQANAVSQQLASIPGIGILTATALAATIGDVKNFANARQLSAYLGLVPRQHSSGGKEKLLGISKRGDGYVRCLLVHGARAVIRHIKRRLKNGQPGGNAWVEQCLQRMHVNEVTVALANKMARTAWALLAHNETWRAA
jgi:transposase